MLMAGCMAVMTPAIACDGPTKVLEARPAAVKAYVLATAKSVLTFGGYSGSGYEDPQAMLTRAQQELAARRPADTLINIGATAVGIGAVYDVAKRMGFTTIGIVSSLARDEKVELSRCVDLVFFVPDTSWGGRLPSSDRLSPTSEAIVEVSQTYIAIGGGDVARDELLAVRQAGRTVVFVPADTNHHIARERARKANRPEPKDFRGAVHAALE
jgi:NADPH:quinone reductase-like Zn-dependent oxidoreductase